ncbi:MAG TPA: GAF domain-containing protein, partial [Lacunisphaera sp.]|nr:GAF domain-containing protein [Lacunisphaera sp.]
MANPSPLTPRRIAPLGSLFLNMGSSGLRSRAGWIAVGYAVFAALWIYFSDQVLALVVPDPDQRLNWGVYKGIGYVVVTTGLLWLFMRRAFGAIEVGYALFRTKTDQLRESEERLEAIIRTAMDAIVAVDGEGQIVIFNAAAERMFGRRAEDALARPVADFVAVASAGLAEGKHVLRGRLAGGGEFALEASVSKLGSGSRPLRTLIIRDIRERQAHEEEIERLKRLYAALSHINQAIASTPGREELFRRVCQVLVGHGGFSMAWIGWHDATANHLVPVASWGDDTGSLKGLTIRTDGQGESPSGVCFRSGRPYISNDLRVDPATLTGREEIERRGWRALAVFPIRERGQVVGVLDVFAHQAGYFQDKEIALLAEAAT